MTGRSDRPQGAVSADASGDATPPAANASGSTNQGRTTSVAANVAAGPATAAPPQGREGGRLRVLWWMLPESVRDVLWPSATPLSEESRAHEAQRRAAMVQDAHVHIDQLDVSDLAHVDSAFGVAQAVLDREDGRRASVESRLSTVLGMTSIASALAIGMLTAFAANAQTLLGSGFTRLTAVVYLYSVAQLVCALTAAIRGVSRQGYPFTSAGELMPQQAETVADYKKRRAKRLIEVADAQHAVDNTKVTAMAVAHTAIRNFVVSVLVLSCIVVGALLIRGGPKEQDGEIVRRLRSNPTLVETLRGPRGEPGLRGPAGAQGPHGVPGVPGGSATPIQPSVPANEPSKTGATLPPH